jgi:hypothetical protein
VEVQTKPVAITWKRYTRLSVRALAAIILLIGAVFGWLVHRAHLQRDTIAAIKRAGGEVWYDWQFRGNSNVPNAGPDGPKWLVDALGVDYFGNVSAVAAQTPKFSDQELGLVANLQKLERLNLNGSSITDAGLAAVRALRNLDALLLVATHTSDAGLVNLKDLSRLTLLDLDQTRVTDGGLAHLRQGDCAMMGNLA